jgi:diacylglycerol kinase (ATP)
MSREPDRPEPPSPGQRRRSLGESFGHAFEGLFYVFNTQPNMRIHSVIIALVLLAAWGFGVNRVEMLHLLVCMSLVLIAEILNTSLELVINLQVEGFERQAKIAKDVAAAAVLVASVYALLAGVAIFIGNENFRGLFQMPPEMPARPHVGPLQIVLVGMLLLGVIVAWIKRAAGSRAFLTGGIVSGHTALGFLIAASIAFISRSAPLAALGLAMALLLAQSRLQSDIHNLSEVALGALLGIVLALLVFAWPVAS